ncbi:hypothetical protein BO78DRAFT_405151 [Aspergillus sclerotiicarbonarius CBS 121057]|uniref:Uncharacterized protein n=1 Tax=Aspergillus sclerotiicarbonarius (strain CBS 121057 / IBT 28362) TaxID=1448318 RepID=A0A319EFY2_ASPSB|nr:hypothetical protein BO78DRAFT_405151 [Aspergillus sclerotiicarbonarius CBS 121057]
MEDKCQGASMASDTAPQTTPLGAFGFNLCNWGKRIENKVYTLNPTPDLSMEDLVPFSPTAAERQQPLAVEYRRNAGYLATANLQDDPNRRGRSGSKWGVKEVNAVRAVPLLDLEPKRIIPARYFPEDGNEDFSWLLKCIGAAKDDDLREFVASKFRGNPYQGFFKHLGELSTTNTSEESIIRSHKRKTSASSATTELSTSSNEDSDEAVSTVTLVDFINHTLMNMDNYKELNLPNRPGRRKPDISGSDRKSYLSVVSLECKGRNAGGLKREVAELLGAMFAQQQTPLPVKHQDQETFVLSMHGTLFYVSAAYFSPRYIAYIRDGSYSGEETFLWVRQSIHFDLKKVEDRGEALRFVWGLVIYISSGSARVNIVSSAIHEASS